MKSKLLMLSVVTTILLAGCSTKQYGRQGELTDTERKIMTCHDIEVETAKVKGFIKAVNSESEFSGKDVLAILGDLYIGNYMEKEAALHSANNRVIELDKLHRSKDCK